MEYYVVQENETLESISESKGIPLSLLKSLNSLTDNPEPGTKLIINQHELSLTNEVYYSTRLGKVKGLLTITEHVILFDPFKTNDSCEIITETGVETGQASLFQVFIDIKDVIHTDIFELQGYRGQDQVFFIEFMLSRTGREKRGIRSDIPKVNVYFKLANILSNGETLQFLRLKTYADQILALVSSSLAQVDKSIPDSGTFVPFYEINKGYIGRLNSGLEVENEDEEFNEILKELLNDESQQQELYNLPEMSTESSFLTPKMISQILAFIPRVFQYRSWKLLFMSFKGE